MAENIKQPKIIIRLRGGLGNQFFQVADVLKHNIDLSCVKLDVSSGYYLDAFTRKPSFLLQGGDFSMLKLPKSKVVIWTYLLALKICKYKTVDVFRVRRSRQFIEGYGFNAGVGKGLVELRRLIFKDISLRNRLCVHVRDFESEGAQGYHTQIDSYYIDAVLLLYKTGLRTVLIGNNSVSLERISGQLKLKGVNAEISNSASAEEDFRCLLESQYRIYSLSSFSVAAHLMIRPLKHVFPPGLMDYEDFKYIQQDLL